MWCIIQGLIIYHTALQGFYSSHTIMNMMSSMNWVCALAKENLYKKAISIKHKFIKMVIRWKALVKFTPGVGKAARGTNPDASRKKAVVQVISLKLKQTTW